MGHDEYMFVMFFGFIFLCALTCTRAVIAHGSWGGTQTALFLAISIPMIFWISTDPTATQDERHGITAMALLLGYEASYLLTRLASWLIDALWRSPQPSVLILRDWSDQLLRAASRSLGSDDEAPSHSSGVRVSVQRLRVGYRPHGRCEQVADSVLAGHACTSQRQRGLGIRFPAREPVW
jgi:hypothetical protein